MESIQKRENSAIRHLKLDNRTDRCWLHGATGNVGHVVFSLILQSLFAASMALALRSAGLCDSLNLAYAWMGCFMNFAGSID